MSFIRSKEIPPGSGNWYEYEVACIWEDGKPRLKHIQYLGKRDGTLKPLIGDLGLEHRVSAIATISAPKVATPMADATRIPRMKEDDCTLPSRARPTRRLHRDGGETLLFGLTQ